MAGTGNDRRQPAPADSGWVAVGTPTAYAAAVVAFGSAGISAVLVVYGGLYVAAGALVLAGAIHTSGSVNRTALRWHVGVWDLWFLLWGILLALATVGYWQRTADDHGPCRAMG